MPDATAPLDVARVRDMLAGTRFADVRYVLETDSTNADAQALLGDAAAHGATLAAEYQRAGVGRKGRAWLAPPRSSLLFTTLLPEPVAASVLWAMPFWISLAAAAGVERAAGVRLDLVWPNDLHAHGRKAGGILSVARISGDVAWVGCGVGINVRRPPADSTLDALQPQPLFLSDLERSVERERVLAAILHAFDESLGDFEHPAEIAHAWELRAGLRGTEYRYRRDADGIERDGTALRLGPHGTLVLQGANGAETAIDMADVRILKDSNRS
ncbi:MAG: biotin--[acetyl-CoA-carboxylase] ligase [Candidatus Velthaea sp.]